VEAHGTLASRTPDCCADPAPLSIKIFPNTQPQLTGEKTKLEPRPGEQRSRPESELSGERDSIGTAENLDRGG